MKRAAIVPRVFALLPGKSARALKNLSLAEDHFADHFPGYPVMPGSLMLEGLAQTGGILVGEVNDFREKVVLAKVPSARFHRDVLAGEVLVYEVELLHMRPEGASVSGRVYAGLQDRDFPPSALIAEAEIFFAHLDKSRSQQLFGEMNFVFTGEMRHLLGRSLPARAGETAETRGA